MTFRKREGRKGEEIEEVTSFNYLGYWLKEDNGDEGRIKVVLRKAKAVLRRV